MEKQMSRRKFLKTGCIAAAAVGLTMCGGGALAASYRPAVETPSKVLTSNGSGAPILVTYATRAGSTAETAAHMAEVLSKGNHPIELRPVKEVTDITPYQTVILGSPARIGQPLPEAVSFVEMNQSQLQGRIFSVFLLCMTLESDTLENRAAVSAYLDPVRSLVKPTHEGLFAGVINLSKLGLLDRLMATTMKTPVGDYRNWEAIDAWAQQSIL
jgi:menaquinone-dependent protoporphyrinogen oxidase